MSNYLPSYVPILTPDGYISVEDLDMNIVFDSTSFVCSKPKQIQESVEIYKITLESGMISYLGKDQSVSYRNNDENEIITVGDLEVGNTINVDYSSILDIGIDGDIEEEVDPESLEILTYPDYLYEIEFDDNNNLQASQILACILSTGKFDTDDPDIVSFKCPGGELGLEVGLAIQIHFDPEYINILSSKSKVVSINSDKIPTILELINTDFNISLKSTEWKKLFIDVIVTLIGEITNIDDVPVITITGNEYLTQDVLSQIQLHLAAIGIYCTFDTDSLILTIYNIELYYELFVVQKTMSKNDFESELSETVQNLIDHQQQNSSLLSYQQIKTIEILDDTDNLYSIDVEGEYLVASGIIIHA